MDNPALMNNIWLIDNSALMNNIMTKLFILKKTHEENPVLPYDACFCHDRLRR
jgi:hypothetical protein